MRTKRELR
jgi:hypothetical protein